MTILLGATGCSYMHRVVPMKKVIKVQGIFVFSLICLLVSVLVLCNIRPADISSKAQELKAYCIDNGYNADYGILVDYGRHSFQKRLFVYDFNREKVILSSLCAHGSGGESTIFMGDFSNVPGSHCSSLGHYRVGRNRNMYRRPVPAFEVHGLDKSNSNALLRGILIHPSAGPLTLGCFGMPVFKYHKLSDWLKTMPQNIVLWAYED